MTLSTGLKIDAYELLKPLKPFSNSSWLARDAEGRESLLRFVSFFGLSRTQPPVDTSLQMEGYQPFQSWKYIELDKIHYWMLQRPYFPQRLSDEIRPAEKASSHFLNRLASFAQIFERLEKAVPEMSFDLSSGNLLLDGDKAVVTDIGLAQYLHYADGERRFAPASYYEQERLIPLCAAYPSIYSYPFLGTGTAYKNVIQRTDSQFAIASLYVWLKTRFLLFEDPQNPYPGHYLGTESNRIVFGSPEFMAILQWHSSIITRIRVYEESGQIELSMINESAEREIVLKALSRERSQAYSSASAFVEALQSLL